MLFWIDKIHDKLISCNKYAQKHGVNFGSNCKFWTKKFGSEPYLITIGDDFYCSSNVQFVNHDGSVNVLRNLVNTLYNADFIAPIKIGNNVFLGYGVTVLPGAVVGDNVIVGACALVKGNLISNSVYAGVPARRICSIEEYKHKINEELIYTKNMTSFEKKSFLIKKFDDQRTNR